LSYVYATENHGRLFQTFEQNALAVTEKASHASVQCNTANVTVRFKRCNLKHTSLECGKVYKWALAGSESGIYSTASQLATDSTTETVHNTAYKSYKSLCRLLY